MFAPSVAICPTRADIEAESVVLLPAKKESGVTFRIPITKGSDIKWSFPLILSVIFGGNNISSIPEEINLSAIK
jgi:hypothetical protein